jgi:hypothetical protein
LGLPIEIATGFLGELTESYREGPNAYWRDDCEDVTEDC